ncbi:MAG TPA: sialate O-acetylesterase, partial [Puia sp.]|nr:sialate O-acetylesterase [Puia sp.]
MANNKLVFILSLFAAPLISPAQVRLPGLFTDNMVLQRDIPIRVWGWAAPGESLRLEWEGRKFRTHAKTDSTWEVTLPAMKAGGPYVLDIRGKNRLVIRNILVGDVWFCSGQSNMVLPMERVKEKYPQDISAANFSQIRSFSVPALADVTKVHEDLPGSDWREANPQNVLAFGAAAYFFARDLYEKYHVPVGIINSSVGGTPIQAWISAEGFREMPDYSNRIARFEDTAYIAAIRRAAMPHREKPERPDAGLSGPVKWYDPAYVPVDWHPFWMPGYWADQGVRGLN